MNRDVRRQSWTEDVARGFPIEKDLDRDPLNDLRKIAGSIIRRQECCRRPACGCYLAHMAVEDLGRIGVYLDVRGIANTNVRKLRLEEVGLDPCAVLNEID